MGIKYTRLKSPVTVQMALTDKCNNFCRYCYNSCRGSEEQSAGLSLENSLDIARRLVENEVFEVVLTGGEPLLRRDLLYPVGFYLSSNNICVPMNTNLVSINDDDALKIKDSGIRSVFGSLSSSNRESYNHITQTRNYENVIRGIDILINAEIPLALNMVVTKLNKDQVYETGKFVKSLGMRSFCATPASPCEYMNQELELDSKEVVGVLDDLLRLKEEFGMSIDVVEPLPRCIVDNPEKYDHFFRRDCAAGKTTAYISPTGDVTPCTHVPKVYGNLLREDLSKIWEKMDEWRDGSLTSDNCNECFELPLCSTGCRGGAKIKSGSYKGMDLWAIEPIRKERVLPVSKKRVSAKQKLNVSKGLMVRKEKEGSLIYHPNYFTITHASDGLMNLLIKLKKRGDFTLSEIANEKDSPKDLSTIVHSLIERRVII